MVRDRLVVGLRNQALSQHLQMDPDLTLGKAKMINHQRKAIREQQGLFTNPLVCQRIPQLPSSRGGKGQPIIQLGEWEPNPMIIDHRPSPNAHDVGEDPTHSSSVLLIMLSITDAKKRLFQLPVFHQDSCSSYEPAPTLDLDDMDDVAYLNTIDSDQGHAQTCQVNVNGHDVLFKKDTGAEVTVISNNITESIGLQQLNHPTKKLHGPHNCPLEVMGEATVRLVYKGQSAHNPSLW